MLIAGILVTLLALTFMVVMLIDPEGKDLVGLVPFFALPLGVTALVVGWSRAGARAVREPRVRVAVGLAIVGLLVLWVAATSLRQAGLRPLRLIEGRLVPGSTAGHVEGVIGNVSNRRYAKIRVRIALRDDTSVVEVVEATIDALEPKSTGAFRAPYRTNRAKYLMMESVQGEPE